MTVKHCSKCGEDKPLSEFYGPRQYYCKVCSKQYASAWAKKNPDKTRAWGKKYHATNPEASHREQLMHHYGMRIEDYNQLLHKQGGVCAVCGSLPILEKGRRRRLAVDHDHSTGEIRGLLCGLCNRGLGQFRDSSEILEKAIRYLNGSI